MFDVIWVDCISLRNYPYGKNWSSGLLDAINK